MSGNTLVCRTRLDAPLLEGTAPTAMGETASGVLFQSAECLRDERRKRECNELSRGNTSVVGTSMVTRANNPKHA
jgi:hypothetical protein